MRRRKAALWLLIFLLLLTLFSGWLVHGTCLSLLRQLDEIDRLCRQESYHSAQSRIAVLTAFYRRREHLLALFLRRDHLSSTDISLSGLAAYAVPENRADLHSEISKAKAQILLLDHLFFSFF